MSVSQTVLEFLSVLNVCDSVFSSAFSECFFSDGVKYIVNTPERFARRPAKIRDFYLVLLNGLFLGLFTGENILGEITLENNPVKRRVERARSYASCDEKLQARREWLHWDLIHQSAPQYGVQRGIAVLRRGDWWLIGNR